MMTYDYINRKITRDFHLRIEHSICTDFVKIDKWVGGVACQRCPKNKGSLYTNRGVVIMCSSEECKSDDKDESVELAQIILYERFEDEALRHYYD